MIFELIQKYWVIIAILIFVVYQVFDHYSFLNLLNKTGKDYCLKNGYEFVEITGAKGHFSIVYKTSDSGKRKYQKFRMDAFLGKVKSIEWIK